MTRSTGLSVICVLACASLEPSAVLAYEDVTNFNFPAASAGGGGRHFTGSPVDGYNCGACHSGGEVPAIRVLGLPITGYVHGGQYEITVDWSDSIEHFAAAVELTDMQGRRAGQLRLPQGDELQDPELCDQTTAIGAEVVRVPPEDMADRPDYCGQGGEVIPRECRQVVHVRECGSQRLRLLWNAPSVDFGEIWFSGSAVAADHDNSDRGDGVAVFPHVLAARAPSGERESSGEVESASVGCSAGLQPGARGHAWVWFAVWLMLSRVRRRWFVL